MNPQPWTFLLAATMSAVGPAALATDYTTLVGGSGGNGFNLDCGANMSLIGIQGKAGSLIDSVQGVCAQINADGSQLGSKVLTAKAGGTGGTSYYLPCLNGTTVTGITVSADPYVYGLTVRCSGATPEYTKPAGDARATSPGKWFSLNCPMFEDARLIRGRSGIWVDAIGLGCKPTERLGVRAVSIATQVRLGQAAPLTVTMSQVPVASINVRLNSSNANLVPSPGVVTVGTTTTKATAAVPATEIGCARITASYKGSSASADMVVHSAASPAISLSGPVIIKRGTSATLRVSIASPNSRSTSIPVTIRGSSPYGPVASLPKTFIPVAPGAVSATFQVDTHDAGCALVTAKEAKAHGDIVTHAIVVVD